MSTKKNSSDLKAEIVRYYDDVSQDYFQHYRKENLLSGKKYPQNYYRVQLLLQRLSSCRIKSVYEVGTGDGTPLAILHKMGLKVAGCDISKKMVNLSKHRLQEVGADPSCVQWADVEDNVTFSNQLISGPFDALIAFGVMPHVFNENLALKNMQMFLKDKGKVFLEFRNKLFSLFTFNRFTKDFILNDLLFDVSEDLKLEVEKELNKRLELNQNNLNNGTEENNTRYDSIKANFHNPFEVIELLEKENFTNVKFHWYHYHPALPLIEPRMKERFWQEACRLEHNASSWRGYFLCSAFVVEAELS